MTAYVPMQCQECGHIVPDDSARSPLTDEDVGIVELMPTGMELKLHGGWFRGRPRGPVLLQLTCPMCQSVTTWYRSGHPKIILNPNKWGRLCGEQEELRLSLGNYLNILIRTVLPMDWDHIWSESGTASNTVVHWEVQDPDARNFCCRLDEGIGSWTGVWGIHPDPQFCGDITEEYLSCSSMSKTGRADPNHNNAMPRYREKVTAARKDNSGSQTQSGTINGFAIERGGLTDPNDISLELKRASMDFGVKDWWEV